MTAATHETSQSAVIGKTTAPEAEMSNSQRVVTSLSAGALAGAIAKTTIAPLDRAKINFQTSQVPFSARKTIEFLVNVYKNEGFVNLWRGNSATMWRIVPYAAAQFCAFEQWKRTLGVDIPGQPAVPHYRRVVAGSLAGVTAVSVTYPLDLARARMAVTDKARYKTILQVFKTIWFNEGISTLYRGFTPTVIGVIPYAGVSFGTYEMSKILIQEHRKTKELGALDRMLCGALAGLLGQSSSYPLDIVRRRMQTATDRGNTYDTVWKTLLKIVRDEGVIGGLYKGLSLNWIKGPIAVGISFTTFDTFQHFFRHLPFLS